MSDAPVTLLIDSRCELGESILWCGRRNVLYWVDILGARLWRHELPTGRTRWWSLPQPLACIGLGKDGRLLLGLAKGLHVCDVEAQLDGDTLAFDKLLDVEAGDAMTRVNDGRADRAGGFVFGTKSEYPDGRRAGRYYQYSAGHGLRELDLPRAAIPNSICFDADGTRMYFCDSSEPRILSCRYDAANAHVSDVQVFAVLDTPDAEPDGSAIDAEGALWNAQWGAGQVVRYLADGRVDRVICVPASQPSCVALGGDSLYITTARVGLSPDLLATHPDSGGVFTQRIGNAFAREENRVVLP